MSNQRELSQQATAFLKEHKPGRYWKERRRLAREVGRQRDLERLRAEVAKIRAPRTTPGYVYVIGCAGHPVKIGIAADVNNRLAGIQTGFPHPLRIYCAVEVSDARAVERACHNQLSAKRLKGEWFDCEPEEAVEVVRAIARPA